MKAEPVAAVHSRHFDDGATVDYQEAGRVARLALSPHWHAGDAERKWWASADAHAGRACGSQRCVNARRYLDDLVASKNELRRAFSQYLSIRYTDRLLVAGVEPSVGTVGDSYDNALAETINGLYKAEVVHRRSWRNLQEVEFATLEWVHWYNHHRLLGPRGYVSPAEAEDHYNRTQALPVRAAYRQTH
ncbi:hypothetical protein BSFA1_83770 (plasmid) [Burkholderia sp. SFA1]|nr:hypothetical protein BSFA1_83770 [Burkholderia sp. SFA1]